jgi:hypothetical protein
VSTPSRIAFISTLSIAALAGTASADLILNGSEAFNWQTFPSTITGGSNASASRPFWDNRSMDGSGSRNIGSYLSGTYTGGVSSSALPSPNIRPSWWGGPVAEGPSAGTSAMDNSLSFSASGTVRSQLRLEVAGYASRNELGWYRLGSPLGEELLNPIFRGPDSAGASASFDVTGDFGLYLKNATGQIFFTESFRNRTGSETDKQIQHFAIFGSSLLPGSQNYFIGVEDLARANTGIENVGDYNDMVFTISAIPAPASALLFGVGVAALGMRHRREKTA